MDTTKFGNTSPGSLCRINTEWGPDFAFTPNHLPPEKGSFPDRLWPLLAEARHHVGMLEGLGRTLPNPGILLRPLEDREAILSSRLEGTYASPRELLLFELDPRESKSGRDPSNDHREVFNYRLALNHGTSSPLPISQRLMKELHALLMSGVRGRDKSPGEFRKIHVGIGYGGRFIPPPPENLAECLDSLEKYCHVQQSSFDPLVDSFFVHYQFETVHPFIDGNGRVGRLLLAIMLQQRCALTKPWLYMSEYFEQSREEYMQRLFDVSARNDWAGWINFCLIGTLKQAKETIHRCERLLAIREGFAAKLANCKGSLRLKRIIDDVFHSPFVRVKDLPKRLGITYPTAKQDVQRLVDAGILKELQNIKPRTYFAPEVFSVAYEKLDNP